jgi:hypothetical protein
MMAMVVVNDVKYDRDCESNYVTIIILILVLSHTQVSP